MRKPSAKFVLKLASWIEEWAAIFPSHPIKGLVAYYSEAMCDLSLEQLDAACLEVTRTVEQFPKPGQIRAALRRIESVPLTRPEYLDEPRLSPQERWTEEEVKLSNALRKKLGLPPCPDRVEGTCGK
jgi:hypothetical protein